MISTSGKMIKRIAGWTILILFLGGLCLVVFSPKEPPVQFRMTDGSVVKVVAVTYGTNQVVVLGNPYQRALYYILPKKFKKLANVSAHHFTTPVDKSLPNFWFLQTNFDYLIVKPLDEFGCECDRGAYAMSTEPIFFKKQNFDGRSLFRYQVMGGFPNGKIIGLMVYDPKTKTNRVASVLAPGTKLKTLPEWKPSPGSIARQGDMMFELKEFVTGLQSVPFNWVFTVTNADLFTEFVFHVTKNGDPVHEWSVTGLNIYDAHGVQLKTWNRKSNQGFKNGDAVYNLQGLLDAKSGPLKLEVTFKCGLGNHDPDVRKVEFEATPVVASRQ